MDPYEWLEEWVEAERGAVRKVWKEVVSNGGSPYWVNRETQEASWNRPDGAEGTDWHRHTDKSGRVFWENRRSKISTWADPALPEAWLTFADKAGKIFYYNTVTKEKSWTAPTPQAASERSDPGFVQHTTEGRIWWHNPTTNQTVWANPPKRDLCTSLGAGLGVFAVGCVVGWVLAKRG